MHVDSETSATVPVEPAGQSFSVEGGQPALLTGAARQWVVCFLIAALGGLAFTIDIPLSQRMVERTWPQPLARLRGPIRHSLAAIEPFGQPAAVISVSLAVLLCGGPGRGVGWRILAGSIGAGLVVDVLKITVARIRPRHFNFQGSVSDTFHSFFPGAAGSSHIQSWPSGHTAMAVGFCLALSTIFPRGRWLFVLLAVMVALQRIESGSHYLSDTLFSAAIAYGVWIVVFGPGRVGRMFDRVEARIASGGKA